MVCSFFLTQTVSCEIEVKLPHGTRRLFQMGLFYFVDANFIICHWLIGIIQDLEIWLSLFKCIIIIVFFLAFFVKGRNYLAVFRS